MASKGNVSQSVSRFDWMKWLLIFIIFAVGIVVNYRYDSVSWAIRAAIGIVVLVVLVAIAYQTKKGKAGWAQIKGARAELRKVVWPTRHETVQTTVIVVVMVIITALILWGMDSLFLWLIGLMTGQRG